MDEEEEETMTMRTSKHEWASVQELRLMWIHMRTSMVRLGAEHQHLRERRMGEQPSRMIH
jgi:hypothetical protein